MPARAGDISIMARNTGPAHNAPRWPEPHEAPAASRQDQVRRHPHAQGTAPAQQQAYPGQYDPYQLPEGYDPYANQAAQGGQQPDYGYGPEGYPEQPGYAAPPPQGGYAHAQPQGGYAHPPQQSGYAPQFEPYQPPQPPQYADDPRHATLAHGGEQSWDQHAGGHWPQHEPAQAQPAHRAGYAPRTHPSQHANAAPPVDPAAYDAGYGQPAASDPYQPPGPPAAHAPPHLRGATYDQSPAYQAEQPGWPQPPADEVYAQQEPAWPQQGYEPAPYPPAQGYEQQGYGQPGGYTNPDYDAQAYGYADPRYGDAGAPYPEFGNAAGQPQEFDADPRFGPADAGYAPPVAAQQDYDDQDYDPEEMAYEDDPPSGRSRFVKMAAALVVAIGIGGGLAYGYKTFMAPSASDKPPVVRKASAPAKIKPDEPGGKKFAHTDSKILGRLSDADAKAKDEADAESDAGSGGTRKVSTMVIGRDGSIVSSPDTERAPPARLPEAVSPVPGMTIVDGFGGRQPQVSAQPPPSAPAMVNATGPSAKAAEPPPPAAAPQAPAPAAKAPAKPVVIARTDPDPEPPKPAASAPKAAPSKPAPATQTARAAPTRQPVSASGAGYVAVLASIPRSSSSRMSALARFADLQQQYAAQLGGKTPDVQEANLGEKGTYHRLIVGPPGSRQEANRLCSELKAAGYPSCWIKSY